VTLADYVARMPEGQDKIYYLGAESLAAARGSPHLEGFRKRGFEVLLLIDRVDEWVVAHLTQFDGKKLESVARASKDIESKIETTDKARHEAEYADTLKRVEQVLKGRIEAARLSVRLTESPVCLVAGEQALSRRLEEMLKRAGEAVPSSLPVLELNPDHALVQRLRETSADVDFADLAELLLGQAVLTEGGQLEDAAAFVQRLNRLLLQGASEGRILLN